MLSSLMFICPSISLFVTKLKNTIFWKLMNWFWCQLAQVIHVGQRHETFNIWRKLSLSCSIVYYYNGTQRYEQFLQVGQLYRALILLSLALFQAPLCLRSSWCHICIKFFCLHPFLYLLVSWAWWDWPLTSLTNHHPSVLWHCWLGHRTCKIVSEITYNVSSGTLNTTIPYLMVNARCVVHNYVDTEGQRSRLQEARDRFGVL